MSLKSDKLNELQEAAVLTLASQLDNLEAYLAELNFDEYKAL